MLWGLPCPLTLRLAARRSLSHLGPISLVLQQEPTPRQALDTLCRYLKLLSAGIKMRSVDEALEDALKNWKPEVKG